MKFNIKVDDEKLIPIRGHDTDAGFDLKVNEIFRFKNSEKFKIDIGTGYELSPGEMVLVDTGVAIELEPGYEGQVRSRSGLALKNQVFVLNSPGTIDAGYRNVIGVILKNVGNSTFIIQKYDRIAQLVINKLPEVELVVKKEINESDRNLNGFGSTGIK